MTIELTDGNFEEIVLGSDKPVLVDFWAEWCGPCKMVGPIMEELSSEYEDKALICKINADINPTMCNKYGIRSIPAILFFKSGELKERAVGARPKLYYQNILNSL